MTTRKGGNQIRHTSKTYGKTTTEKNRFFDSGLRFKNDGISNPSSAGVTVIRSREVDLSIRKNLDDAIAAYHAEGEHRGGWAGRVPTPATIAVFEAVWAATQAGWGVTEIGRRFMRGPSAASNYGRNWVRRATKWMEEQHGEE